MNRLRELWWRATHYDEIHTYEMKETKPGYWVSEELDLKLQFGDAVRFKIPLPYANNKSVLFLTYEKAWYRRLLELKRKVAR